MTPDSRYYAYMIGHISGNVIERGAHYLLVDVHGVGYLVHTTRETTSALAEGSAAALWIHLAVRETALDLYGFPDKETRGLFELLLGVSGIGPRSALSVLDAVDRATLERAVAEQNASYLTTVSGIGKKTAEKIVLELQDKLLASSDGATTAGDADAHEALRSMGYSAEEARGALRQVSSEVESTDERLRQALRLLGKTK